MKIRPKWIVLLVLMHVAMLVLFGSAMRGCIGGGEPPLPRQAAAYICEETGEKFGVPLGAKVYPPIVNPRTGRRTLVRAHVYVPKAGGQPRALWCSKYTDQQIKAMEEYARKTPKEILADEPPLSRLAKQNDGSLIKKPGGQWVTFQQRLEKPSLNIDVGREAETIFEVYPEDWGEILEGDRLKQW